MNIDVNTTDYCKVSVNYEGSPEVVRSLRNRVVDKMSKTAHLPGFRKGKATPEAVRFNLPQQVEEMLKEELAQQAFTDLLAEKGIKPFGNPQFSSFIVLNDTFKCQFDLHTLPEVELKEYKNFELPKYASPLTSDELCQKIIQEMRVNFGTTLPFTEEDRVQLGDQIIIDCSASLNGEPIDNLTFTGTLVQVGKINIPGIDDYLIGMKSDQEKEFDLPIPATFGEKYANQTGHFKVKVTFGSKVVPAALDDDFAKKCGLKEYSELLQQAATTASLRIQHWENTFLRDQISKRLLTNHEIKVPHWITLPEAKIQAKTNKVEWEKLSEEDQKKLLDQAEQSIKLSLILNKIHETEPEAQLTDEETIKIAQLNLQQFSTDPNQTMQDLYNKGQLPVFFGRIRDEYTLDFIIKNSTIIE